MQMKQRVGQMVEREPHPAEFGAQHLEDGLKFGPPGLRVPGHTEVGGLPHSIVKAETGSTAPVRMRLNPFGEHAAEEKRVVAQMGTEGESLFRRTGIKMGQEIRDVREIARGGIFFIGRSESVDVGKGKKDSGDIIGQSPFVERDAPEYAPGDYVKVERCGNLQTSGIVEE